VLDITFELRICASSSQIINFLEKGDDEDEDAFLNILVVDIYYSFFLLFSKDRYSLIFSHSRGPKKIYLKALSYRIIL